MPRTTRDALQQHILEFLFDFYMETGYPPTYREVADAVHSAHSNVWYAIRSLREGGFLRETPPTSAARSLVLTDAGVSRAVDSRHSTALNRTAE